MTNLFLPIWEKLSEGAKKFFAPVEVKAAKPAASAKNAPAPLCKAYGYFTEDREAIWWIHTDRAENPHPRGYLINGPRHHEVNVRQEIEYNIGFPYLVLSYPLEEGVADLINSPQNFFGDGLWRCSFNLPRDGKGTAIFTRVEDNLSTDFTEFAENHLDQLIYMEDLLDAYKIGKYSTRDLNHFEQTVKLTVCGDHEVLPNATIVPYEITNSAGERRVFKVAYMKNHPQIDGGSWIRETMAYFLFGFRAGTVFATCEKSEFGLGKGHKLVVPDSFPHWAAEADMVIADCKPQITSTDATLTFSVLAVKHGEEFAHTDIQSVINMNLWKFLLNWAKTDVLQFLEDVKKGAQEHVQSDEHFGNIVRRANELKLEGFRPLTVPALLRRLWGAMEARFCRMYKKGRSLTTRIPDSRRRYMMVDPHIVGHDFGINPDLCVIRGNTAWLDGLEGNYGAHRQPNAGAMEAFTGTLTPAPELDWAKGSGVMFLSPDCVVEHCATAGGGDQDDALVVYLDPVVVEHFRVLIAQPYPGSKMPPVSKPAARPMHFCKNATLLLMEKGAKQFGIGQAVNPIMWFNGLLLLYKAGLAGAYGIGHVCRSLEQVIDNCVKTGESNQRYKDEVDKFLCTVKYIPRFLAERFGRVLPEDPNICVLRNVYENDGRTRRRVQVVETYADRVLAAIEHMLRGYRFAMDQYAVVSVRSWSNWTTAQKIAGMTFTPETVEAAEAALAYYGQTALTYKTAYLQKGEDEESAGRHAASAAQLDFYTMFGHRWGIDFIMAYIWQKRYSQVYSGGDVSCFNDGILWGEATYELTLKMLARIQNSEKLKDSPLGDPTTALNNSRFMIRGEADADYDQQTVFTSHLGQWVKAVPVLWQERNDENQPTGQTQKDPFTGFAVISAVNFHLVDGTKHGELNHRDLGAFLPAVAGRRPVIGLLEPYFMKTKNGGISTRTQWLSLPGVQQNANAA